MSKGVAMGPGAGAFGPARSNEVQLDPATMSDVIHMFRNVAVIKVARDAFLAMVLCGPFNFSIPRLHMVQTPDITMIIQRYWMPWLRNVYDWLRMFGICPYYFKRANRRSNHQIPIVPDIEKGYITVSVDDSHDTKYRWYWSHGTTVKEDKRMLWVTRDDAPPITGEIISPLSSLLTRYRSLLVLQESQDDAATQAAHPPHLFEYHPPKSASGQDDLTHMTAQFGEKAAGVLRARKDQMKAREMQVRSKELFNQLQNTFMRNRRVDPAVERGRLLWTDTPEDVVKRHNPALYERGVALPADYKAATVTKPTLVADLGKAIASFNLEAAAAMNFPLEMIQPTGSARAQNIQGSIRFINEAIKEWLTFFTSVAHSALIVAYKDQFDRLFDDAHKTAINRQGGDPWDIAQMFPLLDVKVNMQCTPLMSYEDLSQLHMDGLMSKETKAKHAFHLYGLPMHEISISDWPDRVPRDMLVKPTTTTANNNSDSSKGSSSGGGSKKRKESSTSSSSSSKEKTSKTKKTKPGDDGGGGGGTKANLSSESSMGTPASKGTDARTGK
jgi:hypothetical protein